MSDESILVELRMIDAVLEAREYHADGPMRTALRNTISRLTPPPVPADAIQVRIAAGVDAAGAVCVCGIDVCYGEARAMAEAKEQSCNGEFTHESIIVAAIPRKATTVVEGRPEVTT